MNINVNAKKKSNKNICICNIFSHSHATKFTIEALFRLISSEHIREVCYKFWHTVLWVSEGGLKIVKQLEKISHIARTK